MLPVEILPVQDTIVLRARGSELLILPHHVTKLKDLTKPKDFSHYFRAEALINRPARKLFEAWLRKDHTLWPRLYQTVHKEMDAAAADDAQAPRAKQPTRTRDDEPAKPAKAEKAPKAEKPEEKPAKKAEKAPPKAEEKPAKKTEKAAPKAEVKPAKKAEKAAPKAEVKPAKKTEKAAAKPAAKAKDAKAKPKAAKKKG